MKILKILSVFLIPILTACPDPSISEPPQPREALRLVYGTNNRIEVIKGNPLVVRPKLTPEGTKVKYNALGAPAWLTVHPDAGVISASARQTRTPGSGEVVVFRILAAGDGGAYDKQSAAADVALVIRGSETVTRGSETALPAMSYIGQTVSRGGTSTQRTISVNIIGGLTAADADYAFDPPSSKPSWLNISSTGTIWGTVPAGAYAGSTTYTIKVTGKGIYLGETQNVPFLLVIRGSETALPAMSYIGQTVSRGGSSTQRTISVNIIGGLMAADADYAFDPPSSKPSWLNISSTGTIWGTVPADASAGSTTYTIKVTGKGIYLGETQNAPFLLVILDSENALPAMSYTGQTVSGSGRTISASITGGLTAADADYAFDPPSSKPSWLNISSTGTIWGTVPAGVFAGSTTYTIKVTGKGIYLGKTQNVSFTLRITTDACTDALNVTCDQFAEAYLKASNTDADDWFGNSISLSGDTLAVGAPYEDSNATGIGGSQSNNSAGGSGAVYVFTRSGTAWSQQAYLKASNTGGGDRFGYSVSLSGDTLAVGAYGEGSNATGVGGSQSNNGAGGSGAVYVFTRSGTAWSQQAYLKASNTDVRDDFGRSVSLSGDTLAVGATGEDSNATGVNGNQDNNYSNNSGAVYVFTRSGTAWSQQAYLKASNTDVRDDFGYSISLSGDTLAVGARFEASNATGVNGNQDNNYSNNSGAVYVFTRSGTAWSQQAYLKASNTGARGNFGFSVSLLRDTLAIGAYVENNNATGIGGSQSNYGAVGSGAVYVFTRSGTAWSQQAYLKASNTDANDWFGFSVSLSGNTLAISAAAEDSNATGVGGSQSNNDAGSSGAVYVRRIAP